MSHKNNLAKLLDLTKKCKHFYSLSFAFIVTISTESHHWAGITHTLPLKKGRSRTNERLMFSPNFTHLSYTRRAFWLLSLLLIKNIYFERLKFSRGDVLRRSTPSTPLKGSLRSHYLHCRQITMNLPWSAIFCLVSLSCGIKNFEALLNGINFTNIQNFWNLECLSSSGHCLTKSGIVGNENSHMQ